MQSHILCVPNANECASAHKMECTISNIEGLQVLPPETYSQRSHFNFLHLTDIPTEGATQGREEDERFGVSNEGTLLSLPICCERDSNR